jgi:hypothetical protein
MKTLITTILILFSFSAFSQEKTWTTITNQTKDTALIYRGYLWISDQPVHFSWQTKFSGISSQDTVYIKIQVSDTLVSFLTTDTHWLDYGDSIHVIANTIYGFDDPNLSWKYIRCYINLAAASTINIDWSKFYIKTQ